ncbi:MAG: S-layer homology domain-containing protein [bacterium]|nr:S-layer homology domain-containing protein [bacterium]
MRTYQRILVSVLAVLFTFSLGLSAFAAPAWSQGGWMPPGLAKKADKYGWLYLDADQAPWAFPYLAELTLAGIFQGANGYVQPNQPVKIVEAIALCVRLMGEEESALARPNPSLPYADARQIPDWARGYVAVALDRGLIMPHSRNLNPNQAADRLTVAVMVVRAIGREGEALARMNQPLPFRDSPAVPGWAAGYLVVALDLGILTGYTDRTLQPHKPVTRAEMAALLSRAGYHLDLVSPSRINGQVVAVKTTDPRTLTLKHGSATSTYPVADYCAVYAGALEKSLADLKPGDQVKAYLNAAGEVVLVFIQAQQLVHEGTLVQVTLPAGNAAGHITILDAQAAQLSWALAPGAQAVAGGQVIPFSQLPAGSWVRVHLEGNLAVKVELATAQAVRGTVVETATNQHGHPATIRLQLAQGGTVTYQVKADVQVTYQGQPAAFAALRPEDQVEVLLQDGSVSRIDILVKTAMLAGTVASTQVNQHGHPSAVTLTSGTTYPVAADVTVTSPAGQPLTFSALNAGDQVELYLEQQVVRRIRVLGQFTLVTGTVVEIGRNAFGHPESIALLLGSGSQQTFAVAVDVRVSLNGVPMEFAGILSGDQASLKLQGDLVREIALGARPATVAGEVIVRTVNAFGHPKSISIRTSDGQQQQFAVAVTVQVTCEGNPSSFVDVVAGDQVELTVENGKVTFIVVAARAQTITGVVQSRELNAYGHPHRITLETGDPYPVSAAVTVTHGSTPLAFADLRPGDRVELRLESAVVTSVSVLSRTTEAVGALVSKTTNAYGHPASITLRIDGQNQTLAVAAGVQVYRDGNPAAFSTLQVEDYVRALVERDLVTVISVVIRADAFTGVVKGLNSSDLTLLARVTVAGPEGPPLTLDRLVKVTPATVISRGGESLSFADLALEQVVAVTARWEDGRCVALTISVN